VPAADLLAAGTGLVVQRYASLNGPSRTETPPNAPGGKPEPGIEAGSEHLVERPRLTRLLDEATAPVIMLIAPAGFGKTTLARQWVATRRRGWYRGSPAAADVAALAVGLARTASEIIPDVGVRMGERLRATGTPEKDVEPLAELLAEDLESWPEDAWIVFDEYQFACESPFAERFVDLVLALSPLRLFVTSRTRPRWATSRRLLYGEVYEIGRSLLAMSQEEAERVLAHRAGSEVSGLVALADGWPAVIGLAALADDFDIPEAGVPETLYEYFAEELYQAADPDLRWHVSQLALSSSVAPAVAEALLGAEAERAVRDGRRLGFLISSEHGVYEIHPLLRGFLEVKFRELAGGRAHEIIERLVRAHVGRDEWDDGFSLVERFFDADLLIELFEAALPAMLLEARLPTLARWVACAREHEVDAPVVDLAEGELAFRAGDRTRSEALGLQAARRFGDDHPLASRSLGLAGASAHLTYRDETALDYFARAGDLALDDAAERQALWGRFVSTVALESEPAKALDDLETRSGTSADDVLRLGNGRLLLAALEGGFNDALESMRRLAPLLDRARDPLIQSSFLNSYASGLVLSAQYEDALRATDDEIAHAEEYRLDFVLPHAYVYRAGALWGLRRFRQCLICVERAERVNRDPRDGLVLMNIGALRARLHLSMGSIERALDSLERYESEHAPRGMAAEYKGWWSLVYACANERSAALEAAEEAKTTSGRTEVTGLVPWTEAVLELKSGSNATQLVRAAFERSLETGNVDALVAAYRGCPQLLELLAVDRTTRDRLRRVVLRATDHALAQSVGLRVVAPVAQLARGPLSKRESEVLDLLVQGATNREIATALFLSEATVKLHLRHVYDKLGVRGRTEAVIWALDHRV
jgi:DNA-binding CsgD family transcriptional regulator